MKFQLVERGNCDEAWWEVHMIKDGVRTKVPHSDNDLKFMHDLEISAVLLFTATVEKARREKKRRNTEYTKIIREVLI